MADLIKPLILGLALAFGSAAWAQTEQPAAEGAADGLSLGDEVADPDAPGTTYVPETFGDWEMRCVRAKEGNDPCQLYQLLKDEKGNSVAEISVFGLKDGGKASAGATIITPLETLLTPAVTIQVDNAKAKRYPFTFCTGIGCFSRIGFTAAEVTSFKRGNAALMQIVPAGEPDQRVNLAISLTGFTAGYDAVNEANGVSQ